MKRFLAVILVLALFGGIALAADADKASADLCKNAVDPYEWIGQKTLFFKAAGKDNELTEAEFDADKTAGNGFVLSCEKWAAIVAFDKDGKKQIDWLEADAYRRDLRRRVLAAHDTSKDGKLAGEERTAANAALAAGKFATATRQRSGRGAGDPAGRQRGQRGSMMDRSEIIKQYDTDKDGKLSDKEQEAARTAMRASFELRQYDADKNGKLDGNEIAERDKGRAERATRDADREKTRKEMYAEFDKNKNGRIDENERSGIGEWFTKRRYDTNKDGKLDATETAARDKANAESEKRREEFRNRETLRRYDANKDGKLDATETAARDKANTEREKQREETRKRFDKDGDGKLNEAEEGALREYYRSRFGGRGRGGPGGGNRGGRGGGR